LFCQKNMWIINNISNFFIKSKKQKQKQKQKHNKKDALQRIL